MERAMTKYPWSKVKQGCSKAVVAGNLVFCSGMDGSDPETGEITSSSVLEQTKVALDNVRRTLEEAGSSMDNIIDTVILLKNPQDYESMRKAEVVYYDQYAPTLVNEPPASKIIYPQCFLNPDSLIEIEVIAVFPREKSGWAVERFPWTSSNQWSSKAVVAGNLIFCSGMNGSDPETGEYKSNVVEEQMFTALEKIKGTLREIGGTMDNIFETVMLLKDLRDYPRMRETELEYYFKHATLLVDQPPVSTFIQPTSLTDPECLVEIQFRAVLSKNKPGWELRKYPMFYRGMKTIYPYFPAGAPHYSKSVVTGNLIFCSGTTGRTPETREIFARTMQEHMEVALGRLKNTMDEAGSSMDNIIKTFILLKNIGDYSSMREAEMEFYKKHAPTLVEYPPACTVLQSKSLADPKYMVEMSAIGFIPNIRLN